LQASRITFNKPIGSITICGHKFLGCPIPCGVVITRSEYINALSEDVEYIVSRDVTIIGSRCGHAPIFLWYALNKRCLIGDEVQKCIMNARYLHNQLLDAEIGTMLNEFSNIVVFERPLDEDFFLVMQHVTIEMRNSYVGEFLQKRSTWCKDG
ncbi:Serine decarboxylase 1, partial [Glycine soja]